MNKKNEQYWIGFDLGGTKMMAVVLNEKFKVLGRIKKKTKAHEGQAAGLKRMEQMIHELLKQLSIDITLLKGIGIGIPGLLDLERGMILDAPNLGWRRVGIRTTLKKRLGCPVVIMNDVDAGMYGEYIRGAAQKARCAVGIFPGTGIGGGCVYNGEILRGEKNSCMEIGHIQVLSDGPLCGCGQRGCLEAVASRLAISADAAKAVFRGEAPHLQEISGTDLANIRSKALAAAINAGDKSIEKIIREAAQWIGVGVANVVNLLAPNVVVLGGGLVEAMPVIFQEAVAETAYQRVMPPYKNTFKVEVAQLGDDAAVIGSAAWAMQEKKRQDNT